MSRYELAPSAATDLLEIVRYTKEKWGQAQAQHYRDELDLALQRLSLAPEGGQKREAIAPGLRSFPVAGHVAFYIQRKGKMIVLRVLHSRMNVDEAFEKDG
jgi:toxin ParE1/3/4